MTIKPGKLSEAQRAALSRRKEQVKGAASLVGSLLFGSDRTVRRTANAILDDASDQYERRKARAGAIDTEGEDSTPADEEDE